MSIDLYLCDARNSETLTTKFNYPYSCLFFMYPDRKSFFNCSMLTKHM